VQLQLLPFIIGKGGNTKKQLEQETGATLIIPKGIVACC
jgi:rRNA processing protein Krr1/Pno1